MSIRVIGLNHHTAPVDVREQLAFGRDSASTALMLFRKQFGDCEAAIISTCNRVEFYVHSENDSPNESDIITFLAQAKDIPVHQFRNYLYALTGEAAVRHIFRVVSGLDSMVLGEAQIVNQVKNAYALSSEQGTTGRVLNRLFHQAFEVSKRVRTETKIAEGKTSVSSVAVDVAKRIFDDFSSKQTLVVGAGDMAQLVCQYLRDANASRFVVTTRTLANARLLAEACQGQAVPFSSLDEQLVEADIVITATACPLPFITAERVREAQKRRHGRLLFFIDLAVPRNVDSAVAELGQVYVYDIDALGKIVKENQEQRNTQLEACERILDEEVTIFDRWLDQTKLNPLIEQMFRDARDLCDSELKRLKGRCPDFSPAQQKEIERLVERLAGKFMHPCVNSLRRRSASPHFASEFHEAASRARQALDDQV